MLDAVIGLPLMPVHLADWHASAMGLQTAVEGRCLIVMHL